MTKRTAINSLLLSPMLCAVVRACPMCRDSTVASSSSGGGAAPAALFNASVLFLLCALLVVVAFLAFKIVGAIRSIHRAQTQIS